MSDDRKKNKNKQNAARSGGSNVREFRQPVNFNIGLVICIIGILYVSIFVIRYATTKHVVGYRVRTGTISTNSTYTGVALRTEEVSDAASDGYIYYYCQELDRLAEGERVYVLDSTGALRSSIEHDTSEETSFTAEDYQSLSNDIVSFREGFDPSSFRSVYDLKSTLQDDIQKIAGNQILNAVQAADSSAMETFITEDTGYVLYDVDGGEDKTFDTLTAEDFDASAYQETDTQNGSWISAGDPAYKMITSEDWEVVIPAASREEADSLKEEGVIRCRFLKNQYEAYATVGDTRTLDNGQCLVELRFTNSMMSFATDRLVRLELIRDDVTGLKIPKSALVDDEFYVVPMSYVTTGATGNEGVLRQVVDADGEKSSEFVTVTPYTKDGDESNYYLEQTALRDGDVLIRPDSSETITLDSSMLDTLTGVYNINEGYADFRQVTKLTENDDFAIVESNTLYGLREYDYIVLDAATMTPDEFLYE